MILIQGTMPHSQFNCRANVPKLELNLLKNYDLKHYQQIFYSVYKAYLYNYLVGIPCTIKQTYKVYIFTKVPKMT